MYESKTILIRQIPILARKIKKVTGKIINLDHIVLNDKVIVQGIVHKQLYFVATDDKTCHMSDNIPFRDLVEIPGARPGMQASVTADIEETTAGLSPKGDSVIVKFVVKIGVNVEDIVNINVVSGPYGPILAEAVVGSVAQQVLVEETATLENAAVKVAEVRTEPVIQDTEVMENKVIIQAVLHNQVFYVGQDGISHYQTVDIPFSGFVEVPGALPGAKAYVELLVMANEDTLTALQELQLKSVILMSVTVVSETITGIAVAAAGPLYRVNVVIGQPKDFQHLVESSISLQNSALKVREIQTGITDLHTLIIRDKVIIQGILHRQIYYVGSDNISYHQAEDVAFTAFTDYPGALPGHIINLEPHIEYTAFEFLPTGELYVKNIIRFRLTVLEIQNLPAVTGAGIVLHLPQIIGSNTKQIMVTDKEPIVIPGKLVVTKNPIVISEELSETRQTQVNHTVDVSPPAVALSEAHCIIENVSGTPLDDTVIVDGDIRCFISYVGIDDVVHHVEFNDRFSVLVPLPGVNPSDTVEASAMVEHIDTDILPGGNQIRQLITIRAFAKVSREETVNVVTDVEDPGITTEKLLVRVKIPSGEIVEMYVVIEVYDSDLIVTKRTLMLDVVGEGIRPVDVVIDIRKI